MSDLSQGLREHFGDMPDRVHSSTFTLMVEAADEIDRLREALVEVRAFAAVISDQYWMEAVLAKIDAALAKEAGQ